MEPHCRQMCIQGPSVCEMGCSCICVGLCVKRKDSGKMVNILLTVVMARVGFRVTFTLSIKLLIDYFCYLDILFGSEIKNYPLFEKLY